MLPYRCDNCYEWLSGDMLIAKKDTLLLFVIKMCDELGYLKKGPRLRNWLQTICLVLS